MIYETYSLNYQGLTYEIIRDGGGLDISPANDELWNRLYPSYIDRQLSVIVAEVKAEQANLPENIAAAANAAGYVEGIKYALEYLSDLYDGIDETDIWAEYMEADTDTDKGSN